MNIEGETQNFANYVPTAFSGDMIFVCAPGVVHSKVATSDYFRDTFVGLIDNSILPCDFKSGYFHDTDGSVIEILKVLHKINNSDIKEKSIILHSLGEALCYIILGKIQQENKFSACVEKLKSHIIENFSNPEFKVTDADEFSFYNKDYMRQVFKKETGMSPLEYLTDLRLNSAKKLLLTERTPEYKINEIALLCGFYDVGYFIRIFKKKFNVTPTAFRELSDKSALEECSESDICQPDIFPYWSKESNNDVSDNCDIMPYSE